MKKLIVVMGIIALASPAFGASMTITVPDSVVQDVIQAFCTNYNYQETIQGSDGQDIPNPESKAAFTRRAIREYVKNVYFKYKVDQLEAIRKQTLKDAEEAVSGVDVQTVP